MGHATIEGAAKDGAAGLEDIGTTEVLPQAQRDGGEVDATPPATAVGHEVVVTIRCCLVGHG